MDTFNSHDVRNFFFDVVTKYDNKQPLTDLEKIAATIIEQYPQYHEILHNRSKYIDYIWFNNEDNPFVKLSLHLAVSEQIAIDQPIGIKLLFTQLEQRYGHQVAIEKLMKCLTTMLNHAKQHNIPYDQSIYFACIYKQLS
jgi:hypothetical protein